MRKLFLFFFLYLSLSALYSQKLDSLSLKRSIATSITTLGYGASMTGLYFLWYADYPHSQFHLFNDSKEWRGMDKLGHATSSFSLSRANTELYLLTGMDRKKALLWGSLSPFCYMLSIEVFDGFSQGWGFSIADLSSNTAGIAVFSIQQSLWNETRIQLKYSFSTSKYADKNPKLLGDNLIQQSLKDYNGQTYWLSGNIRKLAFPESQFPAWLNLAVGYGADGMINAETKEQLVNFPSVERYSQWYLSPDIDLSAIRSKKPWVRFLLRSFNFIKFPCPGLQFDKKQGMQFKWLIF